MNTNMEFFNIQNNQENSQENPKENFERSDVPMEEFLTVLDYKGFDGIAIEF